MKLYEAIRVIKKAIKEDEGYRISWEANISMAYQDVDAKYNGSELPSLVADEAARNFITLLIRESENE